MSLRSLFTVLHIEDHEWWLDSVRILVGRLPHYRHIGAATTGAKGLDLAKELAPNIVLLDLALPDLDGFTVAQRLDQLPSPPRVLLITGRTDEALLYQLGRGSVAGAIWKNSRIHDQLASALEEIRNGRSFFPPEVRAAVQTLRTSDAAFFKYLSDRELELLPFFGYGMNDVQIAEATCLSPATVKTHRQHIMSKLNLHDRTELMRWCALKGFSNLALPPPAPAPAAAIGQLM